VQGPGGGVAGAGVPVERLEALRDDVLSELVLPVQEVDDAGEPAGGEQGEERRVEFALSDRVEEAGDDVAKQSTPLACG
jgi:hypothetical protein